MISMWYVIGKYYGYPDCCIVDSEGLKHIGKPDRKLTGTGYIPCEQCNKKSIKNLKAAIAKNRICPVAFPNEEDDDEHYDKAIPRLLASDVFSEKEKEEISAWKATYDEDNK